jgi:hypothetical protein
MTSLLDMSYAGHWNIEAGLGFEYFNLQFLVLELERPQGKNRLTRVKDRS